MGINKSYLKDKFLSTKGYKRNSPDVNNPYNVIPSNQITMKGVDFPVMGIDDSGYKQMMYPGQDYTFPGNSVTEFPLKNMGNKRYGQVGLEKPSEAFLKNWVEKRKIRDPYIQEAYAMDQPELIQRAKNFPPVITVPQIGESPDITGRYEADTGRVLKTPTAPPHVITHEQTHYLQDFPNYMGNVHKNIVKNELKPVKEQQGIYQEKYPYFSDPDEVHSRIMVLREKAGFKPDKPVTERKLNKFLKGYKGDTDNINDLLEISKDKKALLNMLNYMAVNEKPTESYGQKGLYKPDFRSKSQVANAQGKQSENTLVNKPKFANPTPKYNLFPDKSFDGLDAAAKVADVVTDVMQIGNFIPFPPAQIVGKVGNWLGAGVDAYQGARSAYKGDYGDMALNFGSALLPSYLSRKGYERPISAVSNSYSGATKYRALNYLSGNNAAQRAALSPFINANRRVAGALAGETAYDANLINGNNYNTVPGGFRDNTNVNQVIIESPKYTGPVLKQGQKLMPVEFGSYKMQMGGTMGIPGVNGQVVSSGPQPLSSVRRTRGPIKKDTKGNVKTMPKQAVKKILKNIK